MHEDEVRATASQVSRLVRGQCPRWADLPVTPLPGDVEGTDHVLFRVGDELVARMPKIASAVGQVESDARWLPVVAPHLPVIVPVPAFVGEPGAGFPWRWSLVPWIPGGMPPGSVATTSVWRRIWRPSPVPCTRSPRTTVRASRPGPEGRRSSMLIPPRARRCRGSPSTTTVSTWPLRDQPGTSAFRLRTGTSHASGSTATSNQATSCGWALGPALTGIDYYRHTFPRMAEHGRRMVRAVIAELS